MDTATAFPLEGHIPRPDVNHSLRPRARRVNGLQTPLNFGILAIAMTPRMKIAKLDEASLEKLRAMEEEFGTCVLALEPQYPLAGLAPPQVQKLEALEKELGVVLLAYKRE